MTEREQLVADLKESRLEWMAVGTCQFGKWIDRAIAALSEPKSETLLTRDGALILFPNEANLLLVYDEAMELVSIYGDSRTRYLDEFESAFVRSALNAHPQPLQGWVMVRRKADDKMRAAGYSKCTNSLEYNDQDLADVWEAMIEAAQEK